MRCLSRSRSVRNAGLILLSFMGAKGGLYDQMAMAQEPARSTGEYRCKMEDPGFGSLLVYYAEPTTYMPAHALGSIVMYTNEGLIYQVEGIAWKVRQTTLSENISRTA